MHFTDKHPKTARFFNTVAEQEDELGCSRQNEPMQARGKQTQTQPYGKATRDATNDSTEQAQSFHGTNQGAKIETRRSSESPIQPKR